MGFWDKVMGYLGFIEDEAAGEIPQSYREKRKWRSVPEVSIDNALLELAKAMLQGMAQLLEEAERYTEDSKKRRDTLDDFQMMGSIVTGILDSCSNLLDTPFGDKNLRDTLGLISTQQVQLLMRNPNIQE